jgi:prolipoprotein diacylglyceryl transferase
VFASIPSPSTNVLEIGPLDVHFYGIAIGLGVVFAAMVSMRRYARFGGDPALMERVAVWGVAWGLLGARAAYVFTHSGSFAGEWWKVFFIWEGGLALFGGLTAGTVAGVITVRRANGDMPSLFDAVSVGIPLAQIVGRFGNYFNQELFGTPSTLPWAVEIDAPFRPAAYQEFATFHPTFLYEQLWNLGVIAFILVWERRRTMVKGNLFLIYAVLYGIGRFLLEFLRTDTTFRLLGMSRNGWVAIAVAIGGTVLLVMRERKAAAGTPVPEEAGRDAEGEAAPGEPA